jgi:hypothetical protein
MGINLPVQIATPSASWTLIDYVTLVRSSPAAAGGLCTATFDQLAPGDRLLIDHAIVSCTSSTPTILRMYLDAVSPLTMLDGSDAGNFDVADWPNGLAIAPTRTLTVQWSGASAGGIGTITLQARLLRQVT